MEKGAAVVDISRQLQKPAVQKMEVVNVEDDSCSAYCTNPTDHQQKILGFWQPPSLAGSLEKMWPWQKEEQTLLHPDDMTEMQVCGHGGHVVTVVRRENLECSYNITCNKCAERDVKS